MVTVEQGQSLREKATQSLRSSVGSSRIDTDSGVAAGAWRSREESNTDAPGFQLGFIAFRIADLPLA